MRKILLFFMIVTTIMACICGCSGKASGSGIYIAKLEEAFELELKLTKNADEYTFTGEADAVISGKTDADKNIMEIEMLYSDLYKKAAEASELAESILTVEKEQSASSLTGYELDMLGCWSDYVSLCTTIGVGELSPSESVEALCAGKVRSGNGWTVRVVITDGATEDKCNITFYATYNEN